MYSRILVPIDGSEPAKRALQEAIAIATATKAGLVVLNAVHEPPLVVMDSVSIVYYNDLLPTLRRAGEELVAAAAKAATEAGLDCESVIVDAATQPVWEAILEQVAACHCDLIVMGTHGRRGLKRLTLGSDAELVVRHASVPVLLVKAAAAPA
jgi:nucleotide-binding universal stress UspA family protein